jgi:hypothetical protein
VDGRAADRGRDARRETAPSAVILAEQALLGAVMSDPVRQAAVLDLVRASDMRRPYHGQVLAAMQRLRAGGVPPGPLRVREELARDPDLPPRVSLDGVLLAGLLEAAPRAVHAPAYAAMVISHGIRRQVSLAGSRMTQSAEVGDLGAARQMTCRACREARDCQERWNDLPEYMRRETPGLASDRASRAGEAVWQLNAARDELDRVRQDIRAGGARGLDERLAAIARRVSAAADASQPPGPGKSRAMGKGQPWALAAEDAGERVLRDLAAGPAQLATVRSWLQPAHFGRPVHGQLYALMGDMHDAGMAVDPVTIAWEASRRGIPVAAELQGGMAHFADAREVHRYGVLARIAQHGRDIAAAASDPRFSVRLLLCDAIGQLHRLERETRPARRTARQKAGGPDGPARATSGPGGLPQGEPGPEAIA